MAGGLEFYRSCKTRLCCRYVSFRFCQFPSFNVADVCLTVGVGILFICILKEEKNGSKS